MLGKLHSTADSYPVSSRSILKRCQVQNHFLPRAELKALYVAAGRARAISLCALTANKHLVGISIQQLKSSTGRSVRRFHIHCDRGFTRSGDKGVKILNLLAF